VGSAGSNPEQQQQQKLVHLMFVIAHTHTHLCMTRPRAHVHMHRTPWQRWHFLLHANLQLLHRSRCRAAYSPADHR
jgi:hypothetical protein